MDKRSYEDISKEMLELREIKIKMQATINDNNKRLMELNQENIMLKGKSSQHLQAIQILAELLKYYAE